MQLSELLESFPDRIIASDFPVSAVVDDSRQVIPGAVFVAIRGMLADGHNFLEDAVRRGAGALLVEDPERCPLGFHGSIVRVQDARDALGTLVRVRKIIIVTKDAPHVMLTV